jgi:putative Mg2+ transporter-C (MgtC) family protein
MDASFFSQLLRSTSFTTEEMMLRLGLATVCGLVLGLDRELRGIAAGLRTHALVSLSSAVITISALDLYEAARAHGGNSDPMRVIQGLARHSRGLCEDSSCYHGLAAAPYGRSGASGLPPNLLVHISTGLWRRACLRATSYAAAAEATARKPSK